VDNSMSGTVTVAHSILWGNTGGDVQNVACTDAVWSLICSPDCSGVNDNICADPQFVNGSNDYHLLSTSPALEHGPDPALFDGNPCVDLDGGPRLRDHDGDDLALVDIGAYERENVGLSPAEVSNLRWSDAQTLIWDAVVPVADYHVYRDSISTLGYDAFGTCRNDLDADRTDTELVDTEVPPPGITLYYLITADDGGGNEGTLGFATCAERSNFTACP